MYLSLIILQNVPTILYFMCNVTYSTIYSTYRDENHSACRYRCQGDRDRELN